MKRFVKYVGPFANDVDYVYFNSKHFYTVMKDGTKRRCNYRNEQCIEQINSGWWKEAGPVERSKKVSTKQPELSSEQHTSQYKIKPFVLYKHRIKFNDDVKGYFTDGVTWFELYENNIILNASFKYSSFDWSNKNIEGYLERGTWIESEKISEKLKKKAKQLLTPKKLKDWEKLGIDPNADYCFASSVAVSIRSGYDVIHGNMYKQARLVEKPVGTQLSVEDGMIMFAL